MAKIDPASIEQKFTDAEYKEHMQGFEKNADETEQRYIAWVNLYEESLMKEYIKRLKAKDEVAINLAHIDWLRQMFITWDYNRVHQSRLEDEINSLIN